MVKVGIAAVVAAALAFAAAGVLADEPAGHEPAVAVAPPPLVIQCTQRRDGPKKWPPRGWRRDSIVAGPFAIVGGRDLASSPAGNFTQPEPVTFELFLLVRADRQVTVSVPPPYRLWTESERQPTGPVTFAACSPWQRRYDSGRVGRWTHFGAGIAVGEPACVPIQIWPDGAEKPLTRQVDFGTKGRGCQP